MYFQSRKPSNLLSELPEYYTFDDDGGNIPIITLEVISDSSNPDQIIATYANEENTRGHINDALNKDAGVHFLTEHLPEGLGPNVEENKEEKDASKKCITQEYLLRDNGSVICNMCGEVLQSRTHWYRHKYKRHTVHALNPLPLFQCEQCLLYFKSRKGYIAHVASRHSELLSDSSPVLTKSQVEITENPPKTQVVQYVKEEPDPELMIPKSSVRNYQTTVVKHSTKATETKKTCRGKEPIVNQADWEERRLREEKLVADIIDRVRRECEAHPRPPVARRPYRRASTATVMRMRQTNAMT